MVFEFNIEFWAFTFDSLGKILIAATALMAHRIIMKHRGIDDIVLKDMRLEFTTGIVGIIMIVIGYALHLTRLGGFK
ncbi:hypothetical protein CMI45_02555 [Candidatus Pacearchaeota archaeon]|nr:hypothetical protein [Candidatus Pacearchaeota archaeon]|tara:strand:+ start:242 stop:472 length:231 start_codon:yes stop_codon:yes gene_type:complete